MAVVYRIKPTPDQVITFTAVVWMTDGDHIVHLKGTVKEVSADLQALTLRPDFLKWRKVV